MSISTLIPPRRSPPKTTPSKTKLLAMSNAIDQYFCDTHNQCREKLSRFRVIDGMDPKPKGRLGGWGTYERLQVAAEKVKGGLGGWEEEEEFWTAEIGRKFSLGSDSDDEDEEDDEGQEGDTEQLSEEGSDGDGDGDGEEWVEDSAPEAGTGKKSA